LESIGVSWRRWPLLVRAVALVELVLLLEESIGVGWRGRLLLLLDTVALVEPVLLLERQASVLVGEGNRCW
jgi:hypothetical protein